jgi:hypothetical protein
MRTNIALELTNNQALHLWGMMASYIRNTSYELKQVGIFTKKGELNKRLKYQYLPELRKEQVDNLALSRLILEHLESVVDFKELQQ